VEILGHFGNGFRAIDSRTGTHLEKDVLTVARHKVEWPEAGHKAFVLGIGVQIARAGYWVAGVGVSRAVG